MSVIIQQTCVVFLAPTRRRRYFSKQAASKAEAGALIRKKYPNERSGEYERGFHWRADLPNAEKLERRLARRILHRSKL